MCDSGPTYTEISVSHDVIESSTLVGPSDVPMYDPLIVPTLLYHWMTLNIMSPTAI